MARERLVGVMTLVHPIPGFFTKQHLDLVQAISDQAGIAVLNARLYENSLYPSEFYEQMQKFVAEEKITEQDLTTFSIILDSMIFFPHLVRQALTILYPGETEEQIFKRRREAMLSLPIVESPLGTEVFLDAVHLYRTARRGGRTVRSSVDCLIAACAIRHDLEVLHRDRDFGVLSEISALRERNP